jgi:hypothetical protein
VKMKCLKLVVVDYVNFKWTITSKSPVDDELQSVEVRALKLLKAALNALLLLGFSS